MATIRSNYKTIASAFGLSLALAATAQSERLTEPDMPGRTKPHEQIVLVMTVFDNLSNRPLVGADIQCTWLKRFESKKTNNKGQARLTITIPRHVPKQMVDSRCTVSQSGYSSSTFTRKMSEITSPHTLRVVLVR